MKLPLIVAMAVATGVAVAQPAAASPDLDCTPYKGVATHQTVGGVTSVPWSWFYALNEGTIELCLDGSEGTDYDLVLWQLLPGELRTVTTVSGGGDDKILKYKTPPFSTYRVGIVTDVAGEYTVGVNFP